MDDSMNANDGPSSMWSRSCDPIAITTVDFLCTCLEARSPWLDECFLLSRIWLREISREISHEDCLTKEYLRATSSNYMYDRADRGRVCRKLGFSIFTALTPVKQLLDPLYTKIQAVVQKSESLKQSVQFTFPSMFCPVIDINVQIYLSELQDPTSSATAESTDVSYSDQPVFWEDEDSSHHEASQEEPPEPHCPGPPLLCCIAGILQLLQLGEILLIPVILLAQANTLLHEAVVAVTFVSLLSIAWFLRTVVAVSILLFKVLHTMLQAIFCCLCSPRTCVKYSLCVVALAVVVLYCLVAVCIASSTSSRKSKSSFVFAVAICTCTLATSLPLDQPEDHIEVHIRGARSAEGAIFMPLEGAPNTGYSINIALGNTNPQKVNTTLDNSLCSIPYQIDSLVQDLSCCLQVNCITALTAGLFKLY